MLNMFLSESLSMCVCVCVCVCDEMYKLSYNIQ